MIGFFLTSNTSYACERTAEKSSCETKAISKKPTSESCQKDCCHTKQKSKKEQHGCNGKCDHSNCTTTAFSFILMEENLFEFNNNVFNFSLEKSVSYHKTETICAGFTSMWLLPKIK